MRVLLVVVCEVTVRVIVTGMSTRMHRVRVRVSVRVSVTGMPACMVKVILRTSILVRVSATVRVTVV